MNNDYKKINEKRAILEYTYLQLEIIKVDNKLKLSNYLQILIDNQTKYLR